MSGLNFRASVLLSQPSGIFSSALEFSVQRFFLDGHERAKAQMQHTQLGLVIYIMAESQAMSCKVKDFRQPRAKEETRVPWLSCFGAVCPKMGLL